MLSSSDFRPLHLTPCVLRLLPLARNINLFYSPHMFRFHPAAFLLSFAGVWLSLHLGFAFLLVPVVFSCTYFLFRSSSVFYFLCFCLASVTSRRVCVLAFVCCFLFFLLSTFPRRFFFSCFPACLALSFGQLLIFLRVFFPRFFFFFLGVVA